MQFNEKWADPQEFRNWHFAEVSIGKIRRICSVFHSQTSSGAIPFWFDDPDYPQRALPLLNSMNPVNRGDYGYILKKSENMEIFVALCRIINDLPDPLIAVQCIHWIEQRKNLQVLDKMGATKYALNGVLLQQAQRRRDFDRLIDRICGAA